jgi:phosphopantethiene--protein transferase domain
MTIGVDIEDISRFEGKSQEFLDRIFTENEQKYCLSKASPASHFAVRFCAKEAVTKALNSINIRQPRLNKIEIYHDDNKCPKIKLPDSEEYANLTVEVSLSHDKTKAIAFVLVERLNS